MTEGGAPIMHSKLSAWIPLKTAIIHPKGGTVTLVGNLKPVVDFSLQEVVTANQSHQHLWFGRRVSACLNLIADGTIRVDEIISATVPLSEGASGSTVYIRVKKDWLSDS